MKRLNAQTARRWRALQRRVEKDGGYESLLPFHSHVELLFGGAPPRKLFYFTKRLVPYFLEEERLIPNDWLIISRDVMPPPEAIKTICALQHGFDAPLMFVGDLDPLDLTIYLVLQAGNPALSETGERLAVTYAGIDDDWLALADRYRLKGVPFPDLSQAPLEREHFEFVHDLIPELESLIGPRSLALLQAGRKLEMEGVCGLGSYRKGFGERLVDHLDAKAERFTRQHRKPARQSGRK